MEIPKISQNEIDYYSYKERCYILEAEIKDKQETLLFYDKKVQELEDIVLKEISEREKVLLKLEVQEASEFKK